MQATSNPGRAAEAGAKRRRASHWLIAVISGLILGLVTMLYMTSCLHCSLALSLIMSLVSTVLTLVLCGLCRAVRCCAALSLSSLSTTSSGRLAVLVVITTLVVGGPVCNVCVNLRAMSSGLACGLQLGRNQSALMTSSMNTLTTRLTSAVSGTTVRVLSTVVAGWEKKWQLPRVLPQIFSYRKFVRIFLSCGKLFFQKM